MTDRPTADAMVWPTLAHKLQPFRVVRWPAYNGFGIGFRNWYFGPWCWINLGWWGVLIGSGTYE